MCGVVGFFPSFQKDKSTTILRKMLTRIKHRGPDESGIYLSDKIALGSVRLSIIGIDSGSMPISNDSKNLWIVFNGEIYNYIELKEGLKKRGYSFKTSSDTEVVVKLYEEFGEEFLNKLNGQFAIAIWDKKKDELFLARDRVGIRPLFYTDVNGTFIFGSEIKSLMEFPKVKMELSPKALTEYFTFWTTISPGTVFKGINEVSPGAYLKINSEGKNIYRYWELPVYKSDEYKYVDIKSAKIQFEKIFSEAVKLRLRADVPVAAYLSGGLDSSITTSFMKKISPDNLKTFSIGFSEKDYDESSYQNIAVEYFNTEHSRLTCKSIDIAEEFENVIWNTETPLLRTAPVPMKLLAKNVKENKIKVVITGEGADELLGGYNIFKETKIRHFWSKFPNSKYRPLLLKKLYPYLTNVNNTSSNILKMFFGFKLKETNSPIYSHLLRWHNTSRIKNYFSDSYQKKIADYNPISDFEKKVKDKFEGLDFLTKAQWIEVNLFMSGYLLSSQGDRMAMANSIEGRYPFLDHNVIEFCMSLSPDLKLNGLNEKYLLKKMMINRIPEEILNRSKQAYRAPIQSVFLLDNLPVELSKLLTKNSIDIVGIFNAEKVRTLFNKMNNSKISEMDNMALTAVLSTQILYNLFIKKTKGDLSKNELIEINKKIFDFSI